jgi:hypothetical protein
LPDLHAQLSLPSTQQQRQQQQQPDPAAAPPSMPRLAGQLLPLRKMPPAFVLILAPLAKFWGAGHTLPLALDVAANSADLQACEQMATAVLTAKRGAGAGVGDCWGRQAAAAAGMALVRRVLVWRMQCVLMP